MKVNDAAELATSPKSPTALTRYERNTELPLMVLSLAVIPLAAVELFGNLRPEAEESLEITYALIWAAFLADYVIRLLLSADKRAYVRHEWFALVLVVLTVPLGANPLEFLRAARTLRLLRVFRFGAVAARGAKRAVEFPASANSQLAVAAASFVTVTLVSSVLVLAVEEGNLGSQINSMGDALWFSLSTVTTVGLGDIVPKSTVGRLFALIPMVAGVILVAVLASNFVKRLSDLARRLAPDFAMETPDTPAGIEKRLEDMARQIARLEATISGTTRR